GYGRMEVIGRISTNIEGIGENMRPARFQFAHDIGQGFALDGIEIELRHAATLRTDRAATRTDGRIHWLPAWGPSPAIDGIGCPSPLFYTSPGHCGATGSPLRAWFQARHQRRLGPCACESTRYNQLVWVRHRKKRGVPTGSTRSLSCVAFALSS